MIDIVMATYNPKERHIKELLTSIIEQTYFHKVSRIIISDDGSEPGIIEYIKELVNTHDNIEFHSNLSGFNGPKNNFQNAIQLSSARYLMFCDQDDIWLEHKIEVLYNSIETFSENNTIPVLITSDAYVVDDELNIISNSFFEYRRFNENSFTLPSLLTQNTSPGCTMMVNRTLCDLAIPMPKEALMHDWWFLLVALRFGKIKFIKEKTILYRQHDNNCIGVKREKAILKLLSGRKKLLDDYFTYFNKVILQLEKIKKIDHYNHNNFFNKIEKMPLNSKKSLIIFVHKYTSLPLSKKLYLCLRFIFNRQVL